MKNIRRDFRKESGVTLIALVITIIVMLIIAGVSLSAITGKDGNMLDEAQRTVQEQRHTAITLEIQKI